MAEFLGDFQNLDVFGLQSSSEHRSLVLEVGDDLQKILIFLVDILKMFGILYSISLLKRTEKIDSSPS